MYPHVKQPFRILYLAGVASKAHQSLKEMHCRVYSSCTSRAHMLLESEGRGPCAPFTVPRSPAAGLSHAPFTVPRSPAAGLSHVSREGCPVPLDLVGLHYRHYTCHVPTPSVPEEDIQVILNAANTLSQEQLNAYQHVTKSIAESIVRRRQKNGPFTSKAGLLEVPGMNGERLDKIVSSITSKTLKTSKQLSTNILTSGLVKPKLKLSQVPNSLVALHIHLPYIVWLKMSSDLEVIEWDSSELSAKGMLRFDPPNFQKQIWEVNRKVPTSNLYIMEEMPLRVNSKQILHYLTQTYVDATLTTLLNQRALATWPPGGMASPLSLADDQTFDHSSPDGSLDENSGNNFIHSVYKLKPRVVNEYFKLSVGGERVSSEQILSKIRHGQCDQAQGVVADSTLWEVIYRLTRKEREQWTQALLIATAFYKLAILKSSH